MLYTLFAERLPNWFQQHIDRLQRDPQYRAEFASMVRRLPLDVWYRSPKWKCTARLQLLAYPACAKCGRRDNLQVHHRTYEHLGIEILHMEDLITLNDQCHEEIHQIQMPLFFPSDHAWYHSNR
jgi:hypothetical protein